MRSSAFFLVNKSHQKIKIKVGLMNQTPTQDESSHYIRLINPLQNMSKGGFDESNPDTR